MARLAVTGEIMLGRAVAEAIADRPPEAAWGRLPEVLAEADARLGNLECAISARGAPDLRKEFQFRAPPQAVEVLKAAGIDYVTLANNHVLDFGDDALIDTLAHLAEAGIAHAGAGAAAEEAWTPAFLDAGGLRVAVVAFTDNEPGWSVHRRVPGVAWAPIDPEGLACVAGAVETARQEADFVVASAHWGPNMRRVPPPNFRAFARGLVEAGADLFWGHSAHLFQGVERVGDRVILYDTGEFLDDYRVDPAERNDLSFVFLVDADRHAVRDVEMIPVRIDARGCRVDLAEGAERDAAVERMIALSAALGTRLFASPRGLRLAPPRQHVLAEG